jgi:gamma-glutamyltranspeptidase/glutathione hydrolase
MTPQQNAEAPRWQHLNESGGSSADESYQGVLQIENRISQETLQELSKKSHDVEELAPYGHGSSVQILEVLPNGTYVAGSDPRCEGQAAGI